LPAAFQTEDIGVTAKVLLELYKQRDQLIQSIFEITGISDIMRGQSNANETATAQNIKAQFGSMRLRDAQREVQRWVRDSYRIKAELICQNFTPEKLASITGMNAEDQLFQQAMQVLRSDDMRGYQIDIETDSTVFEDAEAEKQSRVEMLTAMGGMAQQWMPVVQMGGPPMLKLVGELMSFGVRGFKAGRTMEDSIDEAFQQLAQQQQQAAQQPPPPDPAVVKAEADMKAKEADMLMKREGHQLDMQAKVMDLQAHQQKTAIDMEAQQAKAAFARESGVMTLQQKASNGQQRPN